MTDTCTVDGCEKRRHVKIGYCSAHYAKYKQYGDPLAGRTNKFRPGNAPETCTIEGCNAKHSHGGLCLSHYRREKTLGSPVALYESEKEPKKLCSISGCNRKHYCKSFCSKHYQNWFNHGDAHHAEKNTPMEWLERHKHYMGDECLHWPFARLTNGYAVVRAPDRSRSIASRVMCEIAHGMPERKAMQAAHSCGKGHEGCVNPNHLRWDTAKGNASDKRDHGTLIYGENAPWSKLKTEEVIKILSFKGRLGAGDVADKFGVTKWAIYSIWQGKNWRHIDGQNIC